MSDAGSAPTPGGLAEAVTDYPGHWEADVILADGRTARIRPVRVGDVDLIRDLDERVSADSKYMRFLAPRPRLSEQDLDRFTRVDHVDRIAMVVTLGGRVIGIGNVDRISPTQAEVAFLVADAQHGRGIGTLLLEHLAQAGRERGVTGFVAEVLPENGRMIRTFRAAGYRVAVGFAQGLMRFEFPIAPTGHSVEVMRSREHRAESRSMGRFFVPRAVVVVGASPRCGSIGWRLVHNLVMGGFTGRVYVVHPGAEAVLGLPAYRSVRQVPDQLDLAIVAVPAAAVLDVVRDCASAGVLGLIVVSSGFADVGALGRARQGELLELARGNGMRLVGPNCLGVLNTASEYAMNASLSQVMPPPGRVGFFCQSGAFGVALLQNVADRGLGLSTFVSAGNRADVSGNDLLQYWEDDPRTEVILLYLESIGNPRKFSRIARRVGRSKPVVAVKSGRTTQGVPLGHSVRATLAPQAAVDAMFRQAGVIQVDSLDEMFDVAQLLAHQPLPLGPRVSVVGNSDALLLLAVDALMAHGLIVEESVLLPGWATGADVAAALHSAAAHVGVDALLVVFTPALDRAENDVAEALAAVGSTSDKPLVATYLAFHGVPERMRVPDRGGDRPVLAGRGSVPSYPSPGAAARALSRAVHYGRWVHRPTTPVPQLADVDTAGAADLVAAVLRDHPDGLDLDEDTAVRLVGCYGIRVARTRPVMALREAVTAGEDLGWQVILKATSPRLRRQPFLEHELRDIGDVTAMTAAWDTLTGVLGDPAQARFVVQEMGPPGLPVTVGGIEDPSFGPIVSFGMSGPSSDLLGDVAYRIPPLTQSDAADMVRDVQAAPLFFGYSGSRPLDVAGIEAVIHRVAQLKEGLPQVQRLEVTLLVGVATHLAVRVSARVAPPDEVRPDGPTRRLTGADGR